NSSKAIILITDGENTTNTSVKEIVKKAAEAGVKIFCIGMGSEDGAPIPDKNGGFKKDSNQEMVISKVDEEGLKKLAALSNGKYVRSVTGDMDLDIIYSKGIRQDMEKKTLKSFRQKVWENRFQWFLFPCILLLFVELIISRQKKINTLLIIFGVVFTFSVFNTPISHAGVRNKIKVGSDVKEGIEAFEKQNFEKAEKKFIDAQLKDPDNAHLYYNIGTAAYKTKDYDSALRNFQKALESDDPELKHKTLYNIGNTKYHQGNLKEAINDFEKVIQDYPSDTAAKENLEFIKKKLEEQKKQEQQDKGKNKDNKKKDNKDQQKDKDKNQGNNQDQNQDNNKSEQQDKDKQEKNKQPDKKTEQKQDSQAEKSAKAEKKKEDKTAKPSKQNMLNRLSDKPGKAMMPIFQNRKVEKDW
ncbi:MAG: tetratricopeptide repeat protein, partial [Desulfobacteraceae bacterium]|nr:tetratricopeptide repeat protein [Desulfobacteraceae bacterium]